VGITIVVLTAKLVVGTLYSTFACGITVWLVKQHEVTDALFDF